MFGLKRFLEKNRKPAAQGTWPEHSVGGFSPLPGMSFVPMEKFSNVEVQVASAREEPGVFWPQFDQQFTARHLRGSHCADRPPKDRGGAVEIIEEPAVWISPYDRHFGHFLAENASRILQSVAERPNDLFLFTAGAMLRDEDLKPHFWDILDWFGVPRDQVMIIRNKHLVRELRVAQQAESLGNAGLCEAYLDLLDDRVRKNNLPDQSIPVVYVARSKLKPRFGLHSGEAYLVSCLERLGVTVLFPEKVSVRTQLEIYASAKTLIFAEGSAVHGRQLLGRIPQDVVILNRRKRQRMAMTHLRQRVSRLAYSETTAHQVTFLGPNQQPLQYAAHSVFDTRVLLDTFDALGVPLSSVWNKQDYETARDADVASWLEDIFSDDMEMWMKPTKSGSHTQSQLEAAGLKHHAPLVWRHTSE